MGVKVGKCDGIFAGVKVGKCYGKFVGAKVGCSVGVLLETQLVHWLEKKLDKKWDVRMDHV